MKNTQPQESHDDASQESTWSSAAIESQESNARGTETIASKPGQMQPGATLTRRASEVRWPTTFADAQPVPSLARRVGMRTAVGERITLLTLNVGCAGNSASWLNVRVLP
jgi:hypothetical protein